MTVNIGVDIGGTHTDLIFLNAGTGELRTAKVPSTLRNQAEGLLSGIDALGTTPGEVDLIIHGTTVATNAVIERKGACCGLLTTRGFRDILELRRRDRPFTYGLRSNFAPLVPRYLREEVEERIDGRGQILRPLDAEGVKAGVSRLREAGAEVLVISFMHSYANAAHEEEARRIAREIWPNDWIVTSSEILPAIREFERTSTAVISGYVQPLLDRYIRSLNQRLADKGYRRDLLVVQSNGGVVAGEMAPRFAANTILSGPAAGVTAATAIARHLGISEAVSCDMGGTSLDICVIQKGAAALKYEKPVDFGLPLCVPMVDIDAIGAGGGSLARVDASGMLQVGPDSAGSDPGPVCYGRGGDTPTITDANLALGLLQPSSMIGRGSSFKMDRALALDALQRKIGNPLGLSALEAAEAILKVAGNVMAGNIRRRLVERGLDPRKFSLIAFGGAGPLHANRILRDVNFRSAVIPAWPGLTSAMGCILGQLRHDFMQTIMMPLKKFDHSQIQAVFDRHKRLALEYLEHEGVKEADVTTEHYADCCYTGQAHVLPVKLPAAGTLDAAVFRRLFEAAYEERYSHRVDDAEVSIINLRTAGFGPHIAKAMPRMSMKKQGHKPESTTIEVFFDGRSIKSQMLRREELPVGLRLVGPVLLVQPDSTTFVEPGYQATVQEGGEIIIEGQS